MIEVGRTKHFRWLRGIVAATLILNLTDAVLTVLWAVLGIAQEANPFMDSLLRLGTVPFVLGKIGLVSAGTILLWRFRQKPLAVVALFVSFLAYYFLLLYHLKSMNTSVLQRLIELCTAR